MTAQETLIPGALTLAQLRRLVDTPDLTVMLDPSCRATAGDAPVEQRHGDFVAD